MTPVYRPAGSAGAGDGNFSDLVLNNAGHLAFVERRAAGERLYQGTLNAGAAEFANTDGRFDAFLTPLYPMQLDASGRLLFEARKDDGNGGIYQGPDPAADVYIDATIPSISPAYLEQIRPDGAVLFRGFSFGPGWVVRSGKPLSDVAFRYATHFHSNLVNPPSHYTENAAGGHAFLGNVPINPASSQYWQGIFRGNDLVADRFADNRGPIDRFISGPNLLDDGTIIYAATLDDGGTGLFSGPNVTADRILRTGDPLFGSTVTGLLVDPWHNAVNSRGEIVFFYRLADGRSGIALAVPDPTAGPIVTLMIISPLLRRRR